MTTWLCVTPERHEKTHRIMAALQKGASGKARICNGAPPPGEPFVVWGHRWLAEKIVPRGVASGTDWWLIDNGYYLPAKGGPTGFYSITYRGLSPVDLPNPDMDRLPVQMAPWRSRDDGYVLLALPGPHYGRMIDLDIGAWSRTIEAKVRAHTKRRIVVREKGCTRPLANDLAGASVLVTHSSKVAVDAVLAGVPVIVEPTNPAAPVGSTNLADIETPEMPDRQRWWASLMCQQFTISEMRAGLAWKAMARVRVQADGLSIAPVQPQLSDLRRGQRPDPAGNGRRDNPAHRNRQDGGR